MKKLLLFWMLIINLLHAMEETKGGIQTLRPRRKICILTQSDSLQLIGSIATEDQEKLRDLALKLNCALTLEKKLGYFDIYVPREQTKDFENKAQKLLF